MTGDSWALRIETTSEKGQVIFVHDVIVELTKIAKKQDIASKETRTE